MRAPLFIMSAIASIALLTAPSAAGWETTQWGMSPAEVAAALPGTELVERGATLGDQRVMSRGEYQLGEGRFQAQHYYDADGLAMIAINVRPRDCSASVDALLGRYGNPLRISDQAILRLVIWHDEPADTRIRVMLSSSVCTIYFERLADYRDVDIANAQR